MQRQIVAIGGGGFSMEPDNPAIDDYLLSLCDNPTPRVCFVPTASGDSENYCDRFRRAFAGDRAHSSVLSLFKREVDDIRDFLLGQDLIYVGGGNTVNLLAVWRAHGVDLAMAEAYAAGVVLAGVSAGMNCWFESSVTDSYNVSEYAVLADGLGFLSGSACPHYGAEAGRRELYQLNVQNGLASGFGVNDSAAVHFVDESPEAVVSSVAGRTAFFVESGEDKAVETRLNSIELT